MAVMVHGGGSAGETATIFVTGLTSSDTVTATKGSKSYSGVWGTYTVEGVSTQCHKISKLNEYGTYTITATDGTQTATKTVLVDCAEEYTIEMSYSRLPSGYTEVEYIQSSGTQYINTGVTYAGESIKAHLYANSYVSDQQYFGISADSFRACYVDTYNSRWYIGIGGSESSIAFSTVPFVSDATIEYDSTNHLFKVNDYSLSFTGGSTFNSGTVQILKRYGSSRLLSGRIYSFEIDGKTNLVPCIRDSDSDVGMYDILNDVYRGNSGSGTFTAGDPV